MDRPETRPSFPMMQEPLPPPPVRKTRWTGWIICAVLLVMVATAAGAWWWQNRPIRPVVLKTEEKAVLETKMEALGMAEGNPADAAPPYEKGTKEIVLTERELNGLLNENTTFGNSVKLELADGAVHARVDTWLDKELPVVGGKNLKARARLLVGGTPEKPELILDDVTVWGVSLPNDWLAQLKGRNLLQEVLGTGNKSIPGVRDFRVGNGKLTVLLKE